MSRKLPGSAIVTGSITLNQISGGLNDTTNAAYAQANTARNTANDAYGQANTARDQANTAYGQANNSYSSANLAYAQANAGYAQANSAYSQANSAYGAANTRLSASGGTLSGDLIITGNLTVSGNSTTLNTEVLTVEDADVVLLSNVASTPALNAGVIVNRGTSTNTFLRWDEALDEWGWSDSGTTTYYFEDLRQGLSTTNTTFGTINTSLGTINTSYQAAYAQANTAGTNALNAYGAANNRVLKAGDTMTGQLNISAGGLLVTGNVGFNTAAPQSRLEVNLISGDSNSLMNANSVNDITLLRAPFGANPASASNGQAKWGLRFVGRNDGTYDNGKSAAVYAVSEETAAGYNRTVGLAFHTSSFDASHTERMRITNDGNVGIGTTTPSGKLHLYNSGNSLLFIEGGAGYEAGIWFRENGVNKWQIYKRANPDDLNFYSSDLTASVMTLAAAGGVGIGTLSPSTKLHLYESGASDVLFRITAANGTYDPLIQFTGQGNDITAEGFEIWYDNDVGDVHLSTTYPNDAAAMHFHTRTGASKSTSNERLTITGAGNVGIGTNSPQSKQHNYISSRSTTFSASDGTTWHDLIIQNPNNTLNAAVGIAFELNSSYHGNAGTGIAAVKSTASSDYGADMVFVTRPQNAVAEERLRITSNGNIGIGTTTPGTAKLYVKGQGSSNFNAIFEDPVASGYCWIQIKATGGGSNSSWQIGTYQSGLHFYNDNNSAYRVFFGDNGNVGIGTTSPSGKLHVSGGDVILYSGSAGNSPKLIFGGESSSTDKSIYLETYFLVFKGHNNEGFKFITVDSSGTQSERLRVAGDGTVRPGADNSQSLGSASFRWSNLYTGDLHLSNKGKQNDVDGTWGDWTIQEGEDNLYVINNRSGKKFKIKLEEV